MNIPVHLSHVRDSQHAGEALRCSLKEGVRGRLIDGAFVVLVSRIVEVSAKDERPACALSSDPTGYGSVGLDLDETATDARGKMGVVDLHRHPVDVDFGGQAFLWESEPSLFGVSEREAGQ